MKHTLTVMTLMSALAGSGSALADDWRDIEGKVQAIDLNAGSFVVKGKTFYVTERTRWDDGLTRIADLAVGQKVEVDYVRHNDRLIAVEVELDD